MLQVAESNQFGMFAIHPLAEKLKGGQAPHLYDPVNKNLDKNLGFYFVWKIILNGTRTVCRHFCLNIIDVASF